PLTSCDHRYEAPGYQPGDLLRHLVQIRDGECTFPACSRHARESDFEHALPTTKAAGPVPATPEHAAGAAIGSSNRKAGPSHSRCPAGTSGGPPAGAPTPKTSQELKCQAAAED